MSIASTVAQEVRCSSSWTSKSSGCERDVLGVAAHGVADRADAVDRGRVVAELVGARLRQELAAARRRAGSRGTRRPDFESDVKISSSAERRIRRSPAAESASCPSRSSTISLFSSSLRNCVEVDSRVDHAALLEVLHPLQRLLDVAAGLEHELQEELDELLVGQELPRSRSTG